MLEELEDAFVRFAGFAGCESFERRFFSGDPVELEVERAVDGGARFWLVDAASALDVLAVSVSGVSPALSTTADGNVGSSMLLLLVAGEGLRVNMSLMLLRLSNSGRSFPEKAGRSLVECSRNLLPSLNMPGGFMISSILTSLPRRSTFCLKVA